MGLIHVWIRDMTHSHTVMGLIHVWIRDMTHSYTVMGLIHVWIRLICMNHNRLCEWVCASGSFVVWWDSFTHVMGLIYIWMSHVTYMNVWISLIRMNQSHHVHIRDMTHSYMRHDSFIHTTRLFHTRLECCVTCRVVCMNESCRVYECVVSCVWMSRVVCMNESCRVYDEIVSCVWMSHGATHSYIHDATHAYSWHNTPDFSMSLVMCMNASRHDSFIHTTRLIHTHDTTRDTTL